MIQNTVDSGITRATAVVAGVGGHNYSPLLKSQGDQNVASPYLFSPRQEFS